MPPGFTQVATDRLAQLAQNAFEEEQYDLGVQCINQLATLGWHPTSELVRSLFAVSLCTLPESSSSSKGKAKSNGQTPNYSCKVVDTVIGPNAECIIAATCLLEHLSAIAGSDVILKALVPGFDNEDASFSNINQNQSRNSVERGNGEDGGSNDMISSSILGNYIKEMRSCKSFWQILGLGDMMQNADVKRREKKQGATNRSNTQSREGQEDFLCREEFDREAVWRAISMVLQVSKEDYALQFARLLMTQKSEGIKSARHTIQAASIVELGEVFEVIHAGLSPASLIRPLDNDVTLSKKGKLAEKYRRGGIAADLLCKLFSLLQAGIIDRQALLRRTSDLLRKLDHSAVKLVFKAMRRAGFETEIVAAALKRLQSMQSSEIAPADLKRYKEAIDKLKTQRDKTQNIETLLQLLETPHWTRAQVQDEEDEESMMQLYWSSRDDKGIESLNRDKDVVALLEESWAVSKGGKNNAQLKSLSPNDVIWEKVAFATARRHATMQATTAALLLKLEIIYSIESQIEGLSQATANQMQVLVREMYNIFKSYSERLIDDVTLCSSQMFSITEEKIKQDSDLLEDQEEEEEDHSKYAKVARQNIVACKTLCEVAKSEMKVARLLALNGEQKKSEFSRPQRSSEEMREVQMSV